MSGTSRGQVTITLGRGGQVSNPLYLFKLAIWSFIASLCNLSNFSFSVLYVCVCTTFSLGFIKLNKSTFLVEKKETKATWIEGIEFSTFTCIYSIISATARKVGFFPGFGVHESAMTCITIWQVVKRAVSGSDGSLSDSLPAAGTKRSVRDRLGGNVDGAFSHGSLHNSNKRYALLYFSSSIIIVFRKILLLWMLPCLSQSFSRCLL